MLLVTLHSDKIIGAFLSEAIDSNRSKMTDPESGLFEYSKSGFSVWGIQGNKIWFDNKTIHFGDPESLRIQFDAMKISSEIIENSEAIDLDNLFIFKV